MVNSIVDNNDVALNKDAIDRLFWELNKELRRKMKKSPKNIKADLYVVGGACVVSLLGTRGSTTDIDAMWNIGSEMREAINAVGDRLGLGHKWCNCDFKRTKSFTNDIIVNSRVYKEFDRLVVWMVKPELLLAMKLVAFREHKQSDTQDCISLILKARSEGITVNSNYLYSVVMKYYGSIDLLSNSAIKFINGFK